MNGEVRMIRPAHAHVHVVNAAAGQQQHSHQAQNIMRQQQELQQRLGTYNSVTLY